MGVTESGLGGERSPGTGDEDPSQEAGQVRAGVELGAQTEVKPPGCLLEMCGLVPGEELGGI